MKQCSWNWHEKDKVNIFTGIVWDDKIYAPCNLLLFTKDNCPKKAATFGAGGMDL